MSRTRKIGYHSVVRILLAHNRYQIRGGEDVVVDQEMAMLRSKGHEVDLFELSNDSIQGLAAKVTTAFHTVYSAQSRSLFERKIQSFKPDVVHVHNFFPRLSPSVFDACESYEVPAVLTLHNYRLICPNAMLTRNGKPCELCVTGSAYQGARYGCYKGSKIGTLPVSHMIESHRAKGTWKNKVSKFIALTEFAKKKFVEGGLPAEKIVVKPNFLPAFETSSYERETGIALYVGRLSEEKGIRTLLKAWERSDLELRIIGEGPLQSEVQKHRNVKYLGLQSRTEILVQMQKASFLVFPSEWYEGFPMVLVEALACGLPVVYANIGGIPEIIEEGVTGLSFEPRNVESLQAAVNKMKDSNLAKKTFKNRFNEKENYDQLMAIYSDLKV